MGIFENVSEIKKRIAEAAVKSGRKPEDITLVAATKMNDAERVREAIAAGIVAPPRVIATEIGPTVSPVGIAIFAPKST